MKTVGLILLILLRIWPALCAGIKITSLEVPETVSKGEDATLKCEYDLQSHSLYSVKWYRNGQEFFRYMPSEQPTKVIHKMTGIDVSEEQSTGEIVVLKNAKMSSNGRYKCEVISDAPEFYTADKSAELMIVVVPQEKPIIHGSKTGYHIGDTAKLFCTSAPSRPPAQLAWTINGQGAPPEYIRELPSTSYPDGLEQTKLELKFIVSRSHFIQGEMSLKCSAKISTLYYKTQQHSLEGQFTYSAPVMESRDISAITSDIGGPTASSAGHLRPHALSLKLLLFVVGLVLGFRRS